MAGPVINYAILVGIILSLKLSLIDCQSACFVRFSGGKMTKYCDRRHAALNNVLANIEELARKEAASTQKTAATESTRTQSTSKTPTTKQHPSAQAASANSTTSAMNTTVSVTSSSSGCLIDVMFVLDGSGSFEPYFNDVKKWVQSVAKNLTTFYPGIQLGVLQYSSYDDSESLHQQRYIKTEVKLGTQKYDDFSLAVDEIKLFGYETYTAAALRKVRLDFVNSTNFNRTGSIQIMILITDGLANDSKELPESAEDLREIGVIPIVIGVSNSSRTENRIIANGDESNSERTIWIREISGLKNLRMNWTDYFGNC